MAIVSPLHINKWLPGVVINSTEARAEFLNIYNTINGNLDAANIKTGAVTTAKIVDGAVTDAKISSVAASKIIGVLNINNLPAGIFTTAGGTLTGGLVFNVPASSALIRNYDDEEIILYEGGTGPEKIQLIVGGTTLLRLTKNGVTQWAITGDGTETPTKFKVPVV